MNLEIWAFTPLDSLDLCVCHACFSWVAIRPAECSNQRESANIYPWSLNTGFQKLWGLLRWVREFSTSVWKYNLSTFLYFLITLFQLCVFVVNLKDAVSLKKKILHLKKRYDTKEQSQIQASKHPFMWRYRCSIHVYSVFLVCNLWNVWKYQSYFQLFCVKCILVHKSL